MKLTLKDNIKFDSLALQHKILLQATMLLEGREGALETEKRIYLMMAFVDLIINENLIELCNNDKRDLHVIIEEDIEPFFNQLNDEVKKVYDDLLKILLKHCDTIWNNQHSIVGVIDTILTTIASMSDEDKKDALVKTGEIAEAAFNRRTEIMTEKTEQINSKLENFVRKYQEQQLEHKEEQKVDNAE